MHIGGACGKNAPIGADLVGYHDPGHDAHREAQREQVDPEAQQVAIDGPPGPQP